MNEMCFAYPPMTNPESLKIITAVELLLDFDPMPTYIVTRRQYYYARFMQLFKRCFGGHYTWNLNCLGCGMFKQSCQTFTEEIK